MQVLIENNTQYQITYEQKQLIKSIIKTALELEAYNFRAEVSVTIVSNEEIKELNNEYRSINKITDVLSFPLIDFNRGEKPPSFGKYLLGDIIFSYEKAQEQAKEYGHSVNREIGFFVAHSMLHLMGYDHEDNADDKLMFEKQEEILNKVGLKR